MAEQLAQFAARLARFDPAALVRLRAGRAWGNLPWSVLVAIPVSQPSATGPPPDGSDSLSGGSAGAGAPASAGSGPFPAGPGGTVGPQPDRVVAAAELAAVLGPGIEVADVLERLATRDAQWRVALPPSASQVVEVVPASLVLNAAAAAARTLRELAGRSGERVIRDTLLDHQVITGMSDVDGRPFAVPQRLIQAMVRMGFVDTQAIEIRITGPWTGLASYDRQAWFRPASLLTVRPIVNHPISR